MSISFEITVNGVDHAIEEMMAFDERARLRIDSAQRETAQAIANRARALAPEWLGDLRGSIHAIGTEAVSDSEHAAPTEYGAHPHMPPVSAVTPYAIAHGIPPWALAIHISRFGTPAQPFMRPAAEAERPAYIARVEAAIHEAEL